MTLAQLIEIRDALEEAKKALHDLALSEIDKPNSLYDKLAPTIDKMYFPLAILNNNIFQLTDKEVKIND